LKKQKAKTVGQRYGQSVRGLLVPETVEHEGIEVGRFEVTRAQFAEFDRKYRVETGKENLPAGGITFEQARAYCAWLTKVTGRKYRLPNEAESETLYEKSESGENTLDAWAGYTVNPDDAQALRDRLKSLPVGVLLLEVGKGRGSGKEEKVFDLGGNVAEWSIKDGQGVLRGGSADMPADARGGSLEVAREYRGFRVVRD
jgi:formylglycine-generating enzyme required for sulfatase activity